MKLTLGCSSTYFILTLSTSRRPQPTKLLRNQATMKQSYSISAQVRHTKISHSESSIANGSSLTNGSFFSPLTYLNLILNFLVILSGFRSSFDRGCLSLWFNFRRNVSISYGFLPVLVADSFVTVLSKIVDVVWFHVKWSFYCFDLKNCIITHVDQF